MFAKTSFKTTLAETYKEAELESIYRYPVEPETKTFNIKKHLLLTRPKDERLNELEGVVKMVQKFSILLLIWKRRENPRSNSSPIIREKMKVVPLNHLHTVLLS